MFQVLLLVAVLSYVGYLFVVLQRKRTQVRKIVEDQNLDLKKTYYSISNLSRILIYSFTDHGLVINLKSNALLPNMSLVTKKSIIPYNQIESIEIGQMTTTLKLANAASVDSILFRYSMGGMAGFDDGSIRFLTTSHKTLKTFIEELKFRKIKYSDSTTTRQKALETVLVTVAIAMVAVAIVYFYIW